MLPSAVQIPKEGKSRLDGRYYCSGLGNKLPHMAEDLLKIEEI